MSRFCVRDALSLNPGSQDCLTVLQLSSWVKGPAQAWLNRIYTVPDFKAARRARDETIAFVAALPGGEEWDGQVRYLAPSTPFFHLDRAELAMKRLGCDEGQWLAAADRCHVRSQDLSRRQQSH